MSTRTENVLRTRCGSRLFGTVGLRAGRIRLLRRAAIALDRGPFGSGEQRSPPYRLIKSARFVGAAWWTVVGDQHRDPRQRDRHGNDCQGVTTVVPLAVRDGGEKAGGKAER